MSFDYGIIKRRFGRWLMDRCVSLERAINRLESRIDQWSNS